MNWIKCSERLPNDGQLVLGICGDFYKVLTFRVVPEGKKQDYFECIDNGHYRTNKDILYWTEITPPEE